MLYNIGMENKVREPVQSRSIDKKNRIIETAYDVFAEVGYYNANTTEIAKKAGVSTGIVYGYFKDKRDILLYVLDIYINKVAHPCMEYISNLHAPVDLNETIRELIELTTKIHRENANLHNTLHSLTVSDEEVGKRFLTLEDHVTKKTTEKLRSLGVNSENLVEKVHIAMNSIQSFSHESVYDRHDYIDYEKMKESTVKMLNDLFN